MSETETNVDDYNFKYIMSLNPDDIEGDITELVSADMICDKMNKVEFEKFFRKFYDYFNSYEIDDMITKSNFLEDIITRETNKIKTERLITNPKEETIRIIQEDKLDIEFLSVMLISDIKNYVNKLFEIFDFDDIINIYKKLKSYYDDTSFFEYFVLKIEEKIIELIHSEKINTINYTDEFIIEFMNDIISDDIFKKIISQIIDSNSTIKIAILIEKLSIQKLSVMFEILNKDMNRTIKIFSNNINAFVDFIKRVNIDILDMFYKNCTLPLKINILDKIYDTEYEIIEYFIKMS
jgi:hypothetical protein